jgi:hypothetical protein
MPSSRQQNISLHKDDINTPFFLHQAQVQQNRVFKGNIQQACNTITDSDVCDVNKAVVVYLLMLLYLSGLSLWLSQLCV